MASKETLPSPNGFEFSHHEGLFGSVSDARFMDILRDETTLVHDIVTSTNMYGEFLFVTASRPVQENRHALTFVGLGYHDRREHYLTDTWTWYDARLTEERVAHTLDWAEVEVLIQARRDELAEQMKHYPSRQSPRGVLFEMLADLTDEDGAATEMDDWGDPLED